MSKKLTMGLSVAAALAVAIVSPLQSQAPDPAAAASDGAGELMAFGADRNDRMTVPVSIGNRGPYRFVVDTGAERTVISRELAQILQLAPGAQARMHSMTEVSEVSTVILRDLEVGKKKLQPIHAPALHRRNMGAEGMLGVDSLQSQRVMFDFVKQEMTITPSRRREVRWPADTIVVTARSRFGRLVLVDAAIDGEKVYAIVDTGSQATIGNSVLRRRLERKGKLAAVVPTSLISVTGGIMAAEGATAKQMRIGGVEIRDMPIAFADVHPFAKLGLMDRPAILLGMDALQLFDRVSVDFANKEMRLMRPGHSQLQGDARMAQRQAARTGKGG